MSETLADHEPGRQPTGQDSSSSGSFPDPIPGIIPFGSISLFSGASGAGKTILKAAWCACWRDGTPILEWPTNRPTGLYYLAVDRPWFPTYDRAFTRAGLRIPEDLVVYALVDDPAYDPRLLRNPRFSRYDFFKACLERLAPVPGSIVFVDPAAPMFIHGDQNSANDVMIGLHWFRRCIRDYQITIIGDTNVAKLKADEDFKRPQDRLSGSGAFLAYADTVFNLLQGEDPADPRTLTWAPREGAPGSIQLAFNKLTKQFEIATLQDSGTDGQNDRPTQLLLLLPEDGADRQTWFDLAQQTFVRYSMPTFKRDVDKLFTRELIVRDAWGHYQRRKLS